MSPNTKQAAVTIAVNGHVERFALDPDRFAAWIEGERDQQEDLVPTPGNSRPAWLLKDVLEMAIETGVVVGDRRLTLDIAPSDNPNGPLLPIGEQGYRVLLKNSVAEGLLETTGPWTAMTYSDAGEEASAALRRCLQVVCDEANAMLTEMALDGAQGRRVGRAGSDALDSATDQKWSIYSPDIPDETEPLMEVSLGRAEDDRAVLLFVDTHTDIGVVRIRLNDDPVYDDDPENPIRHDKTQVRSAIATLLAREIARQPVALVADRDKIWILAELVLRTVEESLWRPNPNDRAALR